MANSSIKFKASYESLDPHEQKFIGSFFAKSLDETTTNARLKRKINKITITTSPAMMDYYKHLISKDPSRFIGISEDRRISVEHDLQLAYAYFYERYLLNKNENRHQVINEYWRDTKRCFSLLLALKALPNSEPKWMTKEQAILDDYSKHYLIGITDDLIRWMSNLNYWRLYWVWTGMMLRMALSIIPDNSFDAGPAKLAANAPQNIAGIISWALYFARLFINLIILLKHTIACSLWMSKAEMNTDWQDRMSAQWQQRKFSMLNDLIWGAANLVCYFWWTGSGIWGYYGNVLTAGLLIADLMLTLWRRYESLETQDETLRQFNAEILQLTQDIARQSCPSKKRQLEYSKERVEEARFLAILNAEHNKKGLNADRALAMALVASFIVMTALLTPEGVFSDIVTNTLGMSGAGGLFVFALIYSIYKAYLEVCRAEDLELKALSECENVLNKLSNPVAHDTQEIIELNRRYQELQKEIKYQQDSAQYLYYEGIRASLIEALFPLVMVSAFTLLPFGFGIAALALGGVLSAVSYYWLESQYKPSSPTAIVAGENDAVSTFNIETTLTKTHEAVQTRKTKQSGELLGWLFHTDLEQCAYPSPMPLA